MSSANLDLVHSIYAGWERGDFSSADWAHPEIQWVAADGLTPGTRRGLVGMAQSFRDFGGAWEEYRVKVDEYRQIDAERVLVLLHYSGRGKKSGLELAHLQARHAQLVHVRDAKVIRLVIYSDRALAFADLGLAPDAGTTDA